MFGKPLRWEPLPKKIRKADIEAELVHFRMAAGIPTQADHFNDLGLTVADLRAVHVKTLRAGRYPMGRFEFIDLIIAAKNRHSTGSGMDPLYTRRATFDHPMYTLKALQSEWNRLAAVLAELYPRKTHGPKRIGKSLKAA